MIRLRSKVRVQLIPRSIHIRKILESEQVGIQPFALRLQHIDVVVIVDRNDSPCRHQLILCLMHQSFTLGKICLSVDLGNLLIVTIPVRSRFAALLGRLSRCRGLCLSGHGSHPEGRQHHRACQKRRYHTFLHTFLLLINNTNCKAIPRNYGIPSRILRLQDAMPRRLQS